MSALLRTIAAATLAVCIALPGAQAEPSEDMAALFDALDITGTIAVMEAEGATYGAGVADELLPDTDRAGWAGTVDRIYDADRMQASVEDTLAHALDGTDITPLTEFFAADAGARIVSLELAARAALMQPELEDAARARAATPDADAARTLRIIDRIIADSDLVERNVRGSMEANMMFYRGLADGGAIAMTEEDMRAEVDAQEDETRRETESWLRAFLLLAYDPLPEEDLRAYAELWRTEEGRALNAALFEAYNGMYDALSYLVGQAAAHHMQSAPL